MICTRFICILTSDRRKGYPFLYNHSDSFPSQCAWHQSGCIRWKAAKCKNCKGNQKRILDNIANRIIRKMVDIYDLLFMAVSYTTKSVSCTRCQPHMCCIWISFNLVLIKKIILRGHWENARALLQWILTFWLKYFWRDEITIPSLNCLGFTVEHWKWIRYFILHLLCGYTNLPMLG